MSAMHDVLEDRKSEIEFYYSVMEILTTIPMTLYERLIISDSFVL